MSFDSHLQSFTLTNILVTTFTLLLVRFTILAVYRVFFHPNRNIPGPLIGRITNLYEYYHEIFRGNGGELSTYAREVLHPKYGPIIRTAPDVVRIADKDAWFKIHAIGYTFNVDPQFAGTFGSTASFFASSDTELHRKTRTILLPYFTKKAVFEAEGQVQEKLDKFMKILRNLTATDEDGAGASVNIRDAYTCYLTDFITEFLFEANWNTMEAPAFHHPIADLNHLEIPPLRRALPSVVASIYSMPPWLSVHLLPTMFHGTIYLRRVVHEQMKAFTTSSYHKGPSSDAGIDAPPFTSGNIGNGISRKLIDKLPFFQLGEESTQLFGAAVNSTGWTLCSILYGIVATEGVQERLIAELKAAYPEKVRMDYQTLKELPYLTACIKEGMRYSSSVPGALSRVAPPTGATLCGYYIAPGTMIETTIASMHHNPAIFPSPKKIVPERWIPSETPFPEAPDNLERYLLNFSSGSRMCLGYNLAWIFLYDITARLVREFDVQLGEGLKKDGDWLMADRWAAAKRGDPGIFILKERDE
ncbi:cytochrome P450 [Ascobolus immersus RN42]|uniref:Cytochrome P450 n=1 Tax=Ascobolus immersus RN42 TaxID=1160509 RepID=A0A3N4IGM6_ASCIM|nr:cytochrome P450 [Ascobolus immersus RN42]